MVVVIQQTGYIYYIRYSDLVIYLVSRWGVCPADVDFCDESNNAGSEPVTRRAACPGDVGLWDEPNKAVSELVL